MKLYATCVLLSIVMCHCSSFKVSMMAMFGQSHFLVMNKLAVELAERGHKVSVLVGEDADYAIGKPNVKVFPLSEELLKMNTNSIKSMTDSKTQTSFHQQVKDLVSFQEGYCDHFFQSPEMVEEIRTSNVVIGDATYLCSNLAANKFNLPLIQLNPTPLTTPTMMVFGIINNPAYVPQISTALSRYMGLFDRFKNLGFYLGSCAMLEWFLYPSYKLVKEKHGICPEKTIREVLSTVDLVIIPRDFILGHPQPIPPYVKEVGYFLPSPPKPLPTELETFMQSSGEEGVILVSFGSMVSALDEDIMVMLMKVFARFPQKFLVKLDEEKLPEGSIPSNVRTVKWLPQNDLLGHSKTKLFITHAGANGLAESAYHGVPMICVPLFGDHNQNAQVAKDVGIAEVVMLSDITADQLFSVMQAVLKGKRYHENSARVSRVMRKRPRAPVVEAADLVEYVQALGHMGHLRPHGFSLPFYQLYMLDVLAVLVMALLILIALVLSLVNAVVKMCKNDSSETKKNK